uniref:Ig-like domain-containing protein n=1 Tax=Neogobius melanostomus TaxID=47308 RepID=A0A8C6TR49_9GOBI
VPAAVPAGEILLTQTPAAAAVERGASVSVRCQSSSSVGGALAWYLQKGTESPELLIHSATARHTGVSSHFSGSGSGTDFTLTISGFEAKDEGVYYCQQHTLHDFVSLWYTFGGGTRLELNLGRVEPALTVLPPSRSELAQGKATLMCLANKGFPSDWRVSWKVSGAGVSAVDHRPSPALPLKDGLYSWSVGLTLTAQQWREGAVAVSCEARQGSQSPVSHTLSALQCSQD